MARPEADNKPDDDDDNVGQQPPRSPTKNLFKSLKIIRKFRRGGGRHPRVSDATPARSASAAPPPPSPSSPTWKPPARSASEPPAAAPRGVRSSRAFRKVRNTLRSSRKGRSKIGSGDKQERGAPVDVATQTGEDRHYTQKVLAALNAGDCTTVVPLWTPGVWNVFRRGPLGRPRWTRRSHPPPAAATHCHKKV